MAGGDTTQFLFAPDAKPEGRKYLLALVSAFWTFCLGCVLISVAFDILSASQVSPLALIGAPVVILAALVPNLMVALAIPRLQRYQRTHRYVLIGAFLAGAIIAIPPALVLNTVLFLPALITEAPLITLISYGTIAGVVEEGIKGLLLLYIFFRYRDEFHDPVDGIVLGALIGLGFAMTEDISYFLQGLAGGGVIGFAFTFFLRVFLGWMNHSVFTAITGAALGLARLGPRGGRRVAWAIGGYAVAAGLHNTFNFLASLLDYLASGNPLVNLLGTLPLYGLPWTAMAVLGFLVLRGWHEEAAIVRAELRPEVAAGIVTPEEYATLPDPARRRAFLNAVERARGKAARSAAGKLFQLQIALALQKRHTAFGDRPRVPELHSEGALRARIAAQRATLAAGSPPPPPVAFPALAPPADQPAAEPQRAPLYPPRVGGAGGTAPNGLRLVVTAGEQRGDAVALRDGATLGRSAIRADFVLRDPEVSGLHARVERPGEADLPVLVDAGSTNGTFVNGERVERRALRPGDRVRLGQSELVVTSEAPLPPQL